MAIDLFQGGGGFPKLSPAVTLTNSTIATEVNPTPDSLIPLPGWRITVYGTTATNSPAGAWEDKVTAVGSGMFHGAMLSSTRNTNHSLRVIVDGVASDVAEKVEASTLRRYAAIDTAFVGGATGTSVSMAAIPQGMVRFENSLVVQVRAANGTSGAADWIAVHYSLDA